MLSKFSIISNVSDKTFGEFHHLTRPHWFGSNMRLGSNRFVGRVADLWAIHSGLLKHNFAMITGSGTGLVQVQGMGGIGKTLLAEEYALRFGAAYPGGVFWLRATSDTGEALSTQILRIADHLTAGNGEPEAGSDPRTVMLEAFSARKPISLGSGRGSAGCCYGRSDRLARTERQRRDVGNHPQHPDGRLRLVHRLDVPVG